MESRTCKECGWFIKLQQEVIESSETIGGVPENHYQDLGCYCRNGNNWCVTDLTGTVHENSPACPRFNEVLI